jgi:hypothetical protein
LRERFPPEVGGVRGARDGTIILRSSIKRELRIELRIRRFLWKSGC